MRLGAALALLLLASLAGACPERGGPGRAPAPAPQAEGAAATPSEAPASAPAAAQAAAMCGEHGLPEALCTKCNPALAAVFKARGDWCAAHDVPESLCPVCSPNPPRPAAIGGTAAAPAAQSDWCAGHGLPESKCTKCNPELVATFQAAGDWCAEHGFPESACPICHPQAPPAAAASADWCLEHALPESKCTKCNPALVAEFKQAGDWCAGHGFPESVCPVCHPQAPPAGAEQAALEARTVRLGAPDIEAAAGIATVTARSAAAVASVACPARIAFHGDRVAEVRASVPGIVRAVRAELGAPVAAGDPLFELESGHIGEVQAALGAANVRARTALTDLQRQRTLRQAGVASARGVEVAGRELASARGERAAAEATLRIAGAGPDGPSGRYTLTAPIGGTVVRRPAVLGLLATDDTSLATIADTSVMWALCDVAESDAPRIAIGQTARLTVHGADDATLVGTISWIAAEVDPRTRTVAARVALPNPRGQLRANQFGIARIETGAPRAAVSVPRAAVQRIGEREVVFVRSAPGVYQPRVVRRRGDGDVVQIEGGVRAGDAVVTTGAILLRTELMPGSIGAGCCEVGPAGSD